MFDLYLKACPRLEASEEEAFLLLTDCLPDRGKAFYDSASRSNPSETSIYSWCSSVNLFLRTFATDVSVARKFFRLNSAVPAVSLRSLFISGLDDRIANTVRAYLASNPAADTGELPGARANTRNDRPAYHLRDPWMQPLACPAQRRPH